MSDDDRAANGEQGALDARGRILLTLAALLLLTAANFSRWWLLIPVVGAVAYIWWRSRLSLLRFVKRWLLILPILIGFSLLFLLSYGFHAGWRHAAELTVRITVAVAVVYALTATTPVPVLLHGLGRLGVPSLLIATAAFMYRYGAVLADELQRMRRARECRNFHPNLAAELRDIGWFLAVLMLRAYERSERVYMAMIARGWRADMGWPAPLPYPHRTNTHDPSDSHRNP